MKLFRIASVLGLVALALSNSPANGQATITTEMVQNALRSNSVDRQKAAIAYLSEGAIKTIRAEAIHPDLLNLFQRTSDLTVKGAIVRVLAQVPDFPINFAEKFKPYLQSPSVEIRRGAANGVAYVVKNLVPPDIRNIAPTIGVDVVAGSAVWVQFNPAFIAFEEACTHFLPLADMALRDSDSEVRLAGTEAIRHIGVTISSSLPHPASVRDNERIINIDDNRRIWIALLPTMERLNAVVPDLRFAMLDPSVDTRKGAALAASAICSAKRLAYATRTFQLDTFEGTLPEPVNPFATSIRNLLPHLVARLKDRSPQVRLTAMEAIEFLETDAMPEVDGIVEASRDSDVFVRWVAARSLGKMVPKTPLMEDGAKAITALGEMLGDPDIDVRKAALTALATNGTRARGALDAVLTSASTGSDIEVRLQALKTLETLKGDSTKVVPVLILVLADDEVRIRREATGDLGRLGSAAKSAVPALMQAMRDENIDVRKAAAESILLIEQGR